MVKDPICGMDVDGIKVNLTSEHEGMTFYFCDSSCKSIFDQDPNEYGY